MSGGPVIIGFLILSWLWWHVTRWLAALFGWVDPGAWALAGATGLSALATGVVLFLALRGRQRE